MASALAAGSVTSVSFARNFQSVPVALVGVAISLAAFPSLSAVWASGDRAAFGRLVRTNAVTITVLTIISAVALVVVGPLAIEVLLGGGEFDAEDVRVTGMVLAAFALAVPFDALGHLTARGLYATHNTVLAVLGSLAGFGVTVCGDARAGRRRGRRRDPARVRRRHGGPDRPPGGSARVAHPAGADPRVRARGRGDRRPGLGRRLAVERLGGHDGDEQPVAVRVVALGPAPRQVVAAHLGHVLVGAGRSD